MRKPVLLFDLGNTLVEYFRPGGFTPVLRESIRRAGRVLDAAGHPVPSDAEVERRVSPERWDLGGERCPGLARSADGRPVAQRSVRRRAGVPEE